MSGLRDTFHRKHEEAIAHLLVTTTVASAAQRTGVSERTLRRWLRRADFQAAYRAAKREVISGAVHTLLHAAGTATQTLIEIMNDGDQPATARVSAARTVLTLVMHDLRTDDLDARFAAIEQQLAEQHDHRGFHGRRSPAA